MGIDIETTLGDVFLEGGNNNWKKASEETVRNDILYTDMIFTPDLSDDEKRSVATEDDVESFVFIEHIQMEIHHKFEKIK